MLTYENRQRKTYCKPWMKGEGCSYSLVRLLVNRSVLSLPHLFPCLFVEYTEAIFKHTNLAEFNKQSFEVATCIILDNLFQLLPVL